MSTTESKRNSAPGSSRTGTPAPSGGGRAASKSDAKATSARIGPYVVGKTLGVGSTGRVKLGTHQDTGQRVAIKIISKLALKKDKDEPKPSKPADATATAAGAPTTAPTPADDKPAQENTLHRKLEREISIMKLIQHPSILSLYDVYESADELFLIMELVEGGELFDYLVQRSRLKEPEALNFFQQIIAGVDYCHKHLICHRDLKPENLLLDSNKNIKIADFGMASLQPTGKLLETSCGSPHYASPEIIRGLKYNGQAADVWSCGVILYALLCGNLPFDDENIRRLLQKVKTGIFTIPDSVPPDAADLIQRCMVVDPLKRITIPEIEQHPWFRKRPYTWANTSAGPLRNPPTPESLRPLTLEEIKAGAIESDIISTLGLLGYGDEDAVLRALMTPEANYEKVFYWILCQRKSEVLEMEPADDTGDSTKARRRVSSHGSRSSMYAERAASIYGSMNGSSQQDLTSAPSAISTTDLPTTSATGAESPTTERKRLAAADAQKRRSYNKSPLSAVVPGVQQTKQPAAGGQFTPDLAAKAKEAATHGQRPATASNPSSISPPAQPSPSPVSISASSGSSTVIHAPAPKRSSLLSDVRKKLSMHGSTDSSNSGTQSMPVLPGIVTVNSSHGGGGDKHSAGGEPVSPTSASSAKNRKSADASMVAADVRNSFSASTPSVASNNGLGSTIDASSPGISTAPKRSWFANLFHFKPQAFTLTAPPEVTLSKAREMLEAVLQTVNVQYQTSRDGISLKCKFVGVDVASPSTAATANSNNSNNNNNMTGSESNAVKFKITMNQSSSEALAAGDDSSSSADKKHSSPVSPHFPADGGAIELVCTQQQGSLAAFAQFRENFQREWQLLLHRAN